MKYWWEIAVRSFKPDNFGVVELLAEYFTPAPVAKLRQGTWSHLHDAKLLRWINERYDVKLSGKLVGQAIDDGNDEYIEYWLSHRPEPFPSPMHTRTLDNQCCGRKTFSLIFHNRAHDEEERLELITIAVERDDLELLRLLHEDKDKYPFEKPAGEALELVAESGLLEVVKELCSHHDDIAIETAYKAAEMDGHGPVLEFLSTLTAMQSVSE